MFCDADSYLLVRGLKPKFKRSGSTGGKERNNLIGRHKMLISFETSEF